VTVGLAIVSGSKEVKAPKSSVKRSVECDGGGGNRGRGLEDGGAAGSGGMALFGGGVEVKGMVDMLKGEGTTGLNDAGGESAKGSRGSRFDRGRTGKDRTRGGGAFSKSSKRPSKESELVV